MHWRFFPGIQFTIYQLSIGSGNNLVWKRWQVITWTNADHLDPWHHMPSLGVTELTLEMPRILQDVVDL